ncbi:MAG TPA: VCBS repeat-containing protein, partial [Nitrospirota bacterium]
DELPDVATWGNGVVQVFLQNAEGTLDPPLSYSLVYGWHDLEVGDVNNDGLTDIIVMSRQGVYDPPLIGVLTQKTGGFNPAVYYASRGGTIGVGDANGDGLNDVVNASNEVCVLTQNNIGTLNAEVCYQMYYDPGAVDVDDVNGDGRKDIVVFHSDYSSVSIYLQGPSGVLAAEELRWMSCGLGSGAYPHALAIGDINSDGAKDIITLDRCWGLEVLYR